jgi:hypothetical protein
MDLRGDEKPYDKELSPFALPHVRAEDEEFVSYKDFDNGFKPKKKISVGSMVATIAKVGRLPLLLGKCTKIGKKKEIARLARCNEPGTHANHPAR